MLNLSNITVSIHGSCILNDISCSFRQGETVGIIGPNGSGKTTLFNCISGFVPCVSGEITLQGGSITTLEPHARARRGIGRVFQNFGIFRDMTLLENMLVALDSRPGAKRAFFPWSRTAKENEKIALDYLDQVNLSDKALLKAGSLSGGQMRLLEIVRTLAVGADTFLLDEPTAGVSPKMKEDIVGQIRRLQSLGKTILIIEHDITFIQKFCTRIIVLNDGRIEIDDIPEKVRADERLKDIYFGKDELSAARIL